MKYFDIFISYRRVDENGNISGRDIARTIQKELQLKHYRVFFDYSDIRDNAFDDTILPAIKTSKIFLLVLTEGALVRCSESGDWVRREILTAIQSGCKIIPVCPEKNGFEGWPLSFPSELDSIKRIQISDIHMGSLFEVSMSKLIKDRIEPVINTTGSKKKNGEGESQTNGVTCLFSTDRIDISKQGNIITDSPQITDVQLPYNYQPSLPSLFSRVLLFDKAFGALATLSDNEREDSFFSTLVSECLDLLEFLFIYADHPALEIRRISITENRIMSELESADTPSSNNLLSVFLQDLPQLPSDYFNTETFIFLFRNNVIGCTSPLTIVFTSPQCKTLFQSWSDDFMGVKGQLLFKQYIPFKERGKLFQEYLIHLLSVCHFDNQILRYVRVQSENELSALFFDLSLNKNDVNSIFPALKDGHGNDVCIVVGQGLVVRLGCVRPEHLISTEYCINSQYKTNMGGLVELPIPLVLNGHGILGIHYIKNWPQKNLFILDKGVCKVPLNDRVLPGTTLKYPYLVAEDFLEERIVKLGFNANKGLFNLLGDNDNAYLPPIKPFYFHFFDLSDLNNSLHYQRLNDDRFEVTLDIPVAGNGTKNIITLHRIYNSTNSEIVSIKDYDFRLSIWPDYRLPDDKQNYYSVSVGGTNNVWPKFISLENLDMEYDVKWHQIDNVRFCKVDRFDAIQLSVNGAEALLFPLFKSIGHLNSSPNPLIVGIDLGSSSTRVSYSLYYQMQQSLEISPKQVMNLNQIHEDIPGWMSELTEMRMVQEDLRGFALPPYLPAYEHSKLYTGLKQASDYEHKEAMSEYCDLLVWILKNQIVSDSHGSVNMREIKVNINFPSISLFKIQLHINIWDWAFKNHFGDDVEVKNVDDSLSLHAHILRAKVRHPLSTTLLLDIGKHYSSAAIYDTAKEFVISDSYPIGIGEVWNNELLDYRTNNELYHLWMSGLRLKNDLETSIVHNIEIRMQQHVNWMDYLFVHMPECGMKAQREFFDSNPDFRALHFLLIASVIWKAVLDISQKAEIEHPDVIISGGGFMALKCFMGEHDLKVSIATLFSHFSRNHLKDIRVLYSESTSAKAEGAAILDFLPGPINTKISPLHDGHDIVTRNEVDVSKVVYKFLTFINAFREFDTTGLPLNLDYICTLFEQYASHGTRLSLTQYRNDSEYVHDVFFLPLKGSLASVIREIL